MTGLDTAAKIITRIGEIAHWIAAALMAAATVCSLLAPQFLSYFVGIDVTGETVELSLYGFSVNAPVVGETVDLTAFFLFGIGAVIILLLMAMVFRNLRLIITKSEGTTPFQADNVRMLKEIGIFSLAVPIIGFIMGLVIQLVLGFEAVEISNSMGGFVFGILALFLTQVFARGIQLENDTDGLL